MVVHHLTGRTVPALAFLALGMIAPDPLSAGGARAPGLPALRYSQDSLFQRVGTFRSPAGTSWGNATFFKDHLVIGIDYDEDSAGFQIWDISNPRKPVLAAEKNDAESHRLREIQNYSFATGYGRDLVAIPSHLGMEIWDFTDVKKPKRHGAVALSRGGGKGIYNGVISAAWQPPFIYGGAMDQGLFVVDARDPAAPKQARHFGNSVISGRLGGPAFAIGNLLVLTSMENGYEACGISTFDITDPADPQLIDLYQCATREGSYTAFMSGNRIYGQGVDGLLLVYELTPRFEVNKKAQATARVARGGYGVYQDGFVHSGMSDWYIKYDVRGANPQEVGRFTLSGDNDWAVPLGNLAFVGDDDGPGSEGDLVPHQAGPDTLGPRINFSVPANGAVNLATGSRIGLSFTDNIDYATLNTANFQVRPVGGQAVPGKFSLLMGIVNFTPDAPLKAETAYEVFLKAGGIKDWAGNGIPRDTLLAFTTGTSVSVGRGKLRHEELRKIRHLVSSCADPVIAPLPSALRDPLGRDRPQRSIAPGLYIAPAEPR
jgi:hypothetical protein